MPHTSSAKKRLRQNLKRRQHNRAIKKELKLQLRAVTKADKDVTLEQLREEYNKAAKKLDKAAAKRVIHPNLAARKKSQLARLLNQKAQVGAAPTGS